MYVALAIWNERIAPVWDCAETVLIVDGEPETAVSLTGLDLFQRVGKLVEAGVDTLICGAISRPALHIANAGGIRVVPFISGPVLEVLAAWRENRLDDPVFAMPGCCHRHRRCGRGFHHQQQ
jgi:predicted Fe-Mo cluster-binding NifX family protein